MKHATQSNHANVSANPSADGLRKVAILISVIDPRTADALLDQLPEPVARRIRQQAIELGDVDPEEREAILTDFLASGGRPPQSPVDSRAGTGDPVEVSPRSTTFTGGKDRGDDAITVTRHPIAQTVRPQEAHARTLDSAQPFLFLASTDIDRLAVVLREERPQTVALTIAHLPREQSLATLASLPPVVQAEVVQRLVEMQPPSPEVLHDVAAVLQAKLERTLTMQTTSRRETRPVGLDAMTGLLQGRQGRAILENLSAYNRPLAERLGGHLSMVATGRILDFDDLAIMDDRALATVFRAAKGEEVIMSLIDAPESIAQRIIGLLPHREAHLVRRARIDPGPLRLSDIDRARSRIANLARQMIVEGKIDPPKFESVLA